MNRVWVVVLLSACPAPVRKPASADVVISGSASWGGFSRRADPLEGAFVTLWSSNDASHSTAAKNGDWRVSTPASAVSSVTLTGWAAGTAPLARSLRVGPSTELQLSFALEPLEHLDCIDTVCLDATGGLVWSSAPSGAAADGLLLDPKLAPALPGANALLTSAALELDGGTGLTGTVRLRVPKPAWSEVVDVRPGTGAIEVSTGTLGPDDRAWKPGPEAVLEAEAGWALAETDLAAVRAGTFAAGVTARVPPIARGVIGVFGGPVKLGCVEGTIKIDDTPSAGLALLPFEGRPGASTGAGEVCFETAITSEPQSARVQYAGVLYSSVTVPTPTEPGSCGAAGCRPLGTLNVRGESVVSVAPCSLSLKVVDERGAPVPQAVVIGNDDGLTQATFASICGRMGTRCTLTGSTDEGGETKLVVPAQGTLELSARATTMTGARFGRRSLPGCTKEVVTVTLDKGRDALSVTADFTGSSITWTPAERAFRLSIERDGGVVWSLHSAQGLVPPITYGMAPPTAVVEVPASGVPSTDDLLQLSLDGVTASGIVVTGSSGAVRP